jgi:hypothetical protein
MHQITPILAHGSPLAFLLLAAIFLVGIAAIIGVGFVIQRLLRDVVRFGKEGIPWSWIIVIAGVFSGAFYLLAGPWGLLAGVPILPFFGMGRLIAKRQASRDQEPG